jgi:hypothetical protein
VNKQFSAIQFSDPTSLCLSTMRNHKDAPTDAVPTGQSSGVQGRVREVSVHGGANGGG